jgi:hypothetical protein
MKTTKDFRHYQHEAAAFSLANRRTYLAAKPGSGKTACALAVIDVLMFDRFEISKVLVVGPKRVVPQWPQEAAKWAFGATLRFSLYLGSQEARKAALGSSYDVLGCSFEFFPELVKQFKLTSWPFDLVVFDEASRLRKGGRQGSIGWKAMNAISSKTNARIILMSGSPRPGTAHELFAPVFLLDQGARLGKTVTGFRTEYLEPFKQNRHTGQVYSWKLRDGLEKALYSKISDLYFAVSPDLGLKSVTIDRRVRMPDKIETMCQDLMRNQVLGEDDFEITAASQGTVAGKLHQMCQGATFTDSGQVKQLHNEKLDELEQIAEEVDGPMIVAYWYSHDYERLVARFPHAVDITTEQGLAAAKAGKVDMALLHPASAGHGIDGLQKHFSTVAWFCLPDSFEMYDQCNKRIVRSGQAETVSIYRIIAENGIADERIVRRLAEKEAEQEIFYQHLEGKS